jgi:hypothetical protein
MPWVVGIDEAGYGPLLGPLVCGASAWRVAPEHVDADFWERLDAAVCRRQGRGESRLPVGDSKQIFDRKRGLYTLERSVLAFLHATATPPATLADLLAALGVSAAQLGTACPWYHDLTATLPTDPARSACSGAAARLAQVMQRRDCTCTALHAVVFSEDQFNRRVAQSGNKAAVLLDAILQLVQWGLDTCPGDDVIVRVDRQGGRIDYRAALMRAFPHGHLHVLEVGEQRSAYRVDAARPWSIEFGVGGDGLWLPVALASMVAKYVRELLMLRFNAYWRRLRPGLRPTAGYYTDARRFLTDLGEALPPGVPPRKEFVRSR